MMRIFRASALAFALGTVAFVIPAGAAVAAPGTDCPPGGAGGDYPGASCTLTVSDSSVVPGEDVTVSGSGFQAGTPYTITFHSTPQLLARGTAASSTITRTVTIPTDATMGDHTLVLLGTDEDGGLRELDGAVTVVGDIGPTQTQGAGGLPGTGADGNLLPLLGAGGGLVLVGVGFVAVSRRRRYSAHRS